MNDISKLPSNCVPLAFKEIYKNKSDKEILDALYSVNGYVPGKGGRYSNYIKMFEKFNTKIIERVYYNFRKEIPELLNLNKTIQTGYSHYYRLTLSKFVKLFPVGLYLIRVKKHVLVIRDGIVIDPNFNNLCGKKEILGFIEIDQNTI